MDELKELIVKQLIKETDHNKQIRILQEINEMLLTKYCIKVSEPLFNSRRIYRDQARRRRRNGLSDHI